MIHQVEIGPKLFAEVQILESLGISQQAVIQLSNSLTLAKVVNVMCGLASAIFSQMTHSEVILQKLL